jgi:hypothetical protein
MSSFSGGAGIADTRISTVDGSESELLKQDIGVVTQSQDDEKHGT